MWYSNKPVTTTQKIIILSFYISNTVPNDKTFKFKSLEKFLICYKNIPSNVTEIHEVWQIRIGMLLVVAWNSFIL